MPSREGGDGLPHPEVQSPLLPSAVLGTWRLRPGRSFWGESSSVSCLLCAACRGDADVPRHTLQERAFVAVTVDTVTCPCSVVTSLSCCVSLAVL